MWEHMKKLEILLAIKEMIYNGLLNYQYSIEN